MTNKPIWYDYAEEHELFGGVQRIYRFENSSYGASVIQHNGSHGSRLGLWELAVLYNGDLCKVDLTLDSSKIYTSPITEDLDDDVIGWLTEDEVQNYLAQIDALRVD